MSYARMDGNVVTNIESASLEWVAAQPDPSIFIAYTEDNPAVIGGDYVDGYFYALQPFPSWTRSNGQWLPPVPKPDGLYVWDEETLSWVELT